MSISRFSEIESQINQYFKAQNTLALADSTKSLYNAVIRKKLLPFCREQGIDKLNEKFTESMDTFTEFIRNQKVAKSHII